MSKSLFLIALLSLLFSLRVHAEEESELVDDPLDDAEIVETAETEEAPDKAEPVVDEAEEGELAESGDGPAENAEENAEANPEDTPKAEDAPAVPYALALAISGEISFTPNDESRAGGLESMVVSYKLTTEAQIPDLNARQDLDLTSKIDVDVDGHLFSGGSLICELRLEIPDAETKISISPRKSEEEGRSLHLKIAWPNKIEEAWESYCPISPDQAFITTGEPEIPFQTLLHHSDPPLSSFVLPDAGGTFAEEFFLEYFDDVSDPVYEVAGDGRGTIAITPK